jgi:hypothetical protein
MEPGKETTIVGAAHRRYIMPDPDNGDTIFSTDTDKAIYSLNDNINPWHGLTIHGHARKILHIDNDKRGLASVWNK